MGGHCCISKANNTIINKINNSNTKKDECLLKQVKFCDNKNRLCEYNKNSIEIMSKNNEDNIENNKSSYNIKCINNTISKNIEPDYDEYTISELMKLKIEKQKCLGEVALSVVEKADNYLFEDYEFLYESLNNHFFIKKLDCQLKDNIIRNMSLISLKSSEKEIVYIQGIVSNSIYIIKEGAVRFYKDNKYEYTLTSGKSFGEKSLIYINPREYTAISIGRNIPTLLWSISRQKYKNIIDNYSEENFKENKKFIKKISILKNLSEDQLIILCSNLNNTKIIFKKEEILFKEGDIGDSLYILISGKVACMKGSEILKILNNKGDYFGEISILTGCKRSLDVVAKAKTECYKISINILKQMLGENFIQLLYMYYIKSVFSNFNYYSNNFYFNFVDNSDELEHIMESKASNNLDIDISNNFLLNKIISKQNSIKNTVTDNSADIIKNETNDEVCLNKNLVVNSSIKLFSFDTLESIYDTFEIIYSKKNEQITNTIFTENSDIRNYIIVVVAGNIIIKDTNQIVCSAGEVLFYPEIIEKNSKEDVKFSSIFIKYSKVMIDITSNKILIANPDCLFIKINIQSIEKKLGWQITSILECSNIIKSLKKVSVFNNFSYEKVRYLAENTQLQIYNKDDAVVKEGKKGDKFYFIKSGKLNVYSKGKYLRTLYNNEFFGERALFLEEKRSASVVCLEKSELYYLNVQVFKNLIDSKFREYMIKNINLKDNSIVIKNLLFEKELGHGKIVDVLLVSHYKNKFKYALKVIPKIRLKSYSICLSIEAEKNVLLKIDHPFVIRLVKTLNDSSGVYFLVEYVKGIDLFEVMKDLGIMTKDQAQFFLASMLITCNYLHSKNIIYRDMKPENVIVAENVYYIFIK